MDDSLAERWIADRMRNVVASGIRRAFERAREIVDPINLSIGQPDFDVPTPIKAALHTSVDLGRNGYTVTQGVPELRTLLAEDIAARFPGAREVMVTSGTSGGLMLALTCVVNPGDEVIFFDPYFVAYPHLVRMVGGVPVQIDTYPDFRVDLDRVERAITDKTKAILFNSPANPTGMVASAEEAHGLARLADKHGVLLISDEIYRLFCYDGPFASPAEVSANVLVVDGFSKSHAMTGWRLGYAHGPRRLIEEMIKMQQFTFVCAPSMVQHAACAYPKVDMSGHVREYRAKRDRMVSALSDKYELATPGGAFYLFPRVPKGTATAFVEEAVAQKLVVIPGGVFSGRDTHFRISFAASDRTLERGIEALRRLA